MRRRRAGVALRFGHGSHCRCGIVVLAAEDNSRTPIAKSGTRKTSEPGTHMMTPAAA